MRQQLGDRLDEICHINNDLYLKSNCIAEKYQIGSEEESYFVNDVQGPKINILF